MQAGSDATPKPKRKYTRRARTGAAEGQPSGIASTAAAVADEAKQAAERLAAEERESASVSEAPWPEAQNLPGIQSAQGVGASQAPEVEPPPRTHQSRRKIAKQAAEAASYLIVLIEGAAMMGLGEDARMTDIEKQMIIAPLQRILERASPQVTETIEKFADPVVLMFGFAMWGMRLYSMARDQEEGEGPPPKPPSEGPSSPGGNGKHAAEEPSDESRLLAAGPARSLMDQVTGAGKVIQ